ncbi:uncharacterized protein FOMMEDRAFT_157239 [Fomitiporia mediterranea MF3/22]|uniref:uncharacterized protein n=1 Tax=Fomitiporia mediterranea (strain MF3/22) TaxID=694068 RepID=UPI00044081C8|nr:uncharacterized protein FOMMEDRAFT_157239 [Fomitiporia mediterranea MF3/22]EJD02049.1 hypothetical protein FOMMEDRAFT_157239 [Fomitiporia mediterranea MF3/22]
MKEIRSQSEGDTATSWRLAHGQVTSARNENRKGDKKRGAYVSVQITEDPVSIWSSPSVSSLPPPSTPLEWAKQTLTVAIPLYQDREKGGKRSRDTSRRTGGRRARWFHITPSPLATHSQPAAAYWASTTNQYSSTSGGHGRWAAKRERRESGLGSEGMTQGQGGQIRKEGGRFARRQKAGVASKRLIALPVYSTHSISLYLFPFNFLLSFRPFPVFVFVSIHSYVFVTALRSASHLPCIVLYLLELSGASFYSRPSPMLSHPQH